MFLILTSYQLWHHHGTPILGMLSVNIAVVGGLLGAFSRFIKARDSLIALLLALILCIGGVLGLQASDNDGTALATLLKLTGVLVFLALNVLVVQQILANGLNPILTRRDERRAAAEQG
jgi:predicted tellurium resistance membrane protein TerC